MSGGISALNNVNLTTAKITDVQIFKYGRKDPLSIMPQFMEISIYASLFKPILEAELIINDPVSLHTNYPIVGEEMIEMTYQQTGDDTTDTRAASQFYDNLKQNDTSHSTIGQETTKMTWTVTACYQAYPDDTARSNFYCLKLYSMPYQENIKNNIMKAFNVPYDQSIQTILKDYLKVDPTRVNSGNFEAAKGQVLTVVPNMLPLPTIKWFAQRAVSATANNYNYFFYETLFGFNFKTLQKLITDGKANKNKKSFIYFSNALRDTTLTQQQQTSILQSTVSSISFSKRYATQEKVMAGYFENEYFEIDIWNKKITSTPFTLPTTVNPGSIANNAINTPDYIKYQQSNNSLPGTKTRVHYVIGQNGGDDPTMPNYWKDKFGPGSAAISGLSQIRVTIAVPGDTRVIPGDVITLQLPEFHGFNQVQDDPYISGDYIITDMKHQITVGMNHVMVLDLARDSFNQLISTKHNYNLNVNTTN